MARRGDMPSALAHVDAKHSSPRAAVVVVGVIIAGFAATGSVKTTWFFSAFTGGSVLQAGGWSDAGGGPVAARYAAAGARLGPRDPEDWQVSRPASRSGHADSLGALAHPRAGRRRRHNPDLRETSRGVASRLGGAPAGARQVKAFYLGGWCPFCNARTHHQVKGPLAGPWLPIRSATPTEFSGRGAEIQLVLRLIPQISPGLACRRRARPKNATPLADRTRPCRSPHQSGHSAEGG